MCDYATRRGGVYRLILSAHTHGHLREVVDLRRNDIGVQRLGAQSSASLTAYLESREWVCENERFCNDCAIVVSQGVNRRKGGARFLLVE